MLVFLFILIIALLVIYAIRTKRISSRLRESEELFKAIFEYSPDPLSIVTLDGTLIKYNKAFTLLYGYKDHDLLNFNCLNLWKDQKKRKEFIAELAGKGHVIDFPFDALCKDGSIKNCALTAAKYKSSNGNELAFVRVKDLTEELKIKKQMEEYLEKFKKIFEISPAPISINKLENGEFIEVNNALLRLLGYSREELIGRGSVELGIISRDIRNMFVEKLQRGERVENQEIVLRAKDGNELKVLFSMEKLAVGHEDYSVSAFQDVSELLMLQDRVKKERDLFKLLVENIPFGVILADEKGKYLYMSERFTQLTGYTMTDAPDGRTLFRLTYPDPQERKRVISLWIHDKSITPRGLARPRVFEVTCKDGGKRLMDITSISLKEGGDLVIFRDITEEAKVNARLFQQQKMEALGSLAGGVAHDFNNILQGIMGFTQVLLSRKGRNDPEWDKLKSIEQAVNRATELIKQLLAFGGRVESKKRLLDLNQEIRQQVKLLSRTIPKMIEIRLELSQDLPGIFGDPVELGQVIMNLAINARDAMPDGGKLIFETKKVYLDEIYAYQNPGVIPGEYVVLSVTDTGIGMDKETLERIFEPFFTTKGPDRGSGLGLSIVYNIVRGHNGLINCYSAPGHGTTFKVYLPAAVAEKIEEEETALEHGDQEDLRGEGEVLVVDDEEGVLRLLEEVLTRFGYKAILARSGEEALPLVEQRGHELRAIILDLIMPGMGGIKAFQRIRELAPELPVIISSGYFINGDTRELLMAQGAGFISKPFDTRELLKALVRITRKGG